jgi:hypothetical protein
MPPPESGRVPNLGVTLLSWRATSCFPRMDYPSNRSLCRFALCLVFGLAALLPAGRGQEVEVSAVKFAGLRSPSGSAGNWLENEITLIVKPVAGTPGQMVSRVKVGVLLGFELPATAGAARRFEHYRAEAECVALEPGRANVRFYLPPELVKRDQMHGDPKYWGVELSVGGRPLPAVKAAYALALASPEQRKNFQTRGAAAATANDGLLLPQYLTPFVNEYPRATPSFVRHELR